MAAKVFIDGEAGTTGLQIRDRLADLASVEVISIDNDLRKDRGARKDMMRAADVTILCLPDDAAREAVALADELGNDAPRIIDASTAHRIASDWVYGFAELDPGNAQAEKIASATRVANPGCYATGAIALIRPLTTSGELAEDYPFTINAVSGYSGGGKSMIANYDAGTGPVFEIYGLKLDHKHLPEIVAHSALSRAPIFIPSVGNFPQGMLVSVPLQLGGLDAAPSIGELDDLFAKYYKGAKSVCYHGLADHADQSRLSVDPSEGSDDMEIWVFGDEAKSQALLVARLDNLGKGAAGAAVQNLRLMLGLSDD